MTPSRFKVQSSRFKLALLSILPQVCGRYRGAKAKKLKETVEESHTAAVVSASNISKGRTKMVVYESPIKADKN